MASREHSVQGTTSSTSPSILIYPHDAATPPLASVARGFVGTNVSTATTLDAVPQKQRAGNIRLNSTCCPYCKLGLICLASEGVEYRMGKML